MGENILFAKRQKLKAKPHSFILLFLKGSGGGKKWLKEYHSKRKENTGQKIKRKTKTPPIFGLLGGKGIFVRFLNFLTGEGAECFNFLVEAWIYLYLWWCVVFCLNPPPCLDFLFFFFFPIKDFYIGANFSPKDWFIFFLSFFVFSGEDNSEQGKPFFLKKKKNGGKEGGCTKSILIWEVIYFRYFEYIRIFSRATSQKIFGAGLLKKGDVANLFWRLMSLDDYSLYNF